MLWSMTASTLTPAPGDRAGLGDPVVPAEITAPTRVAESWAGGHPRSRVAALRLVRRSERAVLDRLLDDARDGRSGALVIRGEPGIGKTALLEYAVKSAVDLRVVRAEGVESEREWEFGALHQLCAPLLDRLDRLPGPQRDALAVAFGLSDGTVPDRFFVGLAVLSLLSNAAEERPLVCVIDDAHLLDTASAQALAFVPRRLLTERVAMLFAARDPRQELRALPELRVEGLRDAEARQVLDSVIPWSLDTRVADQIVAESRGNPRALVELPRAVSPAKLAGGFGLPGALSLEGQSACSWLARVEALPAEARRLLLVAAAEPGGDPALVCRAARRLGIPSQALEPAVGAALIEVGTRVRFRHPLLRAIVYRAAAPGQRREAHRALAEATDAATDPDRRAWHLAEASAGADEQVAGELERSAQRAHARAGLAAAAAFLERATLLSAQSARRTERAVAAAQASLDAGLFDAAHARLAVAESGPLDRFQRAKVELLRGQIAFFSAFGTDAKSQLLKAARRLEPLDVNLASDTYLEAWGAALLAGHRGCRSALAEVSQVAVAAPRPAGMARPTDLLLDGLVKLATDGLAEAVPRLQQATRTFIDGGQAGEASLRPGWLAVVPSLVLWDDESADAICVRQTRALRDAGALARLPLGLNMLGLLAARSGDFDRAGAAVAEATAVTDATGTGMAPFAAATLAALRGRETEAMTMVRSVRTEAIVLRQGLAAQLADWAYAILCNGLGRYGEALAAARDASPDGPAAPFLSGWAAIEMVEAATRSHKLEAARCALKRVESATVVARTDAALGLLARCRALMSRDATADRLYREAIARLTRTPLRPERARAHLLYGEWLRRENRRLDARAQLRAAHDQFTAIGMEAFAERARSELLATGERVHKRTIETRDELTAQEHQIAQLARAGVSNAAIGAKLFISRRTVEYHLSKVFTKLDISSRHELDRVLPAALGATVPSTAGSADLQEAVPGAAQWRRRDPIRCVRSRRDP